jgi:transposase
MKRSSTPTFVVEYPLDTTPKHKKSLNIILDVKRQIKNACTGEFRKRLKRLRSDPNYKKAISMPKGKYRNETFKLLEQKHGFTLAEMNLYTKTLTKTWLNQHVDSALAQKIGEDIWQAFEEYRFKGKGKPRFKTKKQVSSIEGKSNKTGIIWRNYTPNYFDATTLVTQGYYVKIKGMKIPVKVKRKDEVQCWGLLHKVKYCRIVRRVIHKHERFFVQLVLEGRPFPYQNHPIGKGKVGLDLGPSIVAIVGEQEAHLLEFCPDVIKDVKEFRRVQRQIDRQRRKSNPDNYNINGTIKEGPKVWNISNRQKQNEAKLREIDRALAARRNTEHGRLANLVIAMGDDIRHEKVSIKAWQKLYGRSIGRKAPGSFQNKVDRKAESAGGRVSELSPYKTKLSQTCQCGHVKKKERSERWHNCSNCGLSMQRDLYSAYLPLFVEDNVLDAGRAQAQWPSMETFLQTALEDAKQRAIEKGYANPNFGLSKVQSQSSSSVKLELNASEAKA